MLQKPPVIKFKDLEAAVNSTIRYNLLPMKARADFMRITNSSIMTNITLQFDNRDLQFQDKEGVSKAVVNIYSRITSMTRRPVNIFEDTVTIEAPSQMLADYSKRSSVYQKAVPLPPGMYRMNVVAKDVISGNMNNYEMALHVPHFDEEKLGSSTVVLADLIEKVPTRSIGTGQFVIGTSKVRPRLTESFKRDEKMGIYVQYYNFQADEKTLKPNGVIEYEVVKSGDNKKVFEFTEELSGLENASANQVTVEKMLPLKSFEPGQYTIKMKVTDRNRNQTLTQAASFTVN
jgi:hypothetical protein